MELYAERGFEQTTVAEIAARAGLTERTFFRHYADKREVLFYGTEMMQHLLVEAVAAARRRLVVAANSELQERGLLKHARITKSITAALRERGTDELTARLGAEMGIAFGVGQLLVAAVFQYGYESSDEQA